MQANATAIWTAASIGSYGTWFKVPGYLVWLRSVQAVGSSMRDSGLSDARLGGDIASG
jgi:hypothetical protein